MAPANCDTARGTEARDLALVAVAAVVALAAAHLAAVAVAPVAAVAVQAPAASPADSLRFALSAGPPSLAVAKFDAAAEARA